MKTAQLRNRLKIATFLAAGLVFPVHVHAQVTNRTNQNSDASAEVPRGNYRNKSLNSSSNSRPAVMYSQGESLEVPEVHTAVVPASAIAPRNAAQRNTSASRSNSQGTVTRVTQASHVEQASCKSCQSGNAHVTSAPYQQQASEPIFDQYSSVQSPEAYQFGSSCDSMCGPGFRGHPLGLIGTLLQNSQIRVEAATYWGDGQNVSPLVTTRRPASDPATDGTIGNANTINLFGGREMLGDSVQGIRGEIGMYLDPCQSSGVLLRLFDASKNTESYTNANGLEPVVMRPFFSTADNAQSTIAINYPNSSLGTIAASMYSDVYGGDILLRRALHQEAAGKFEFLAGYQMMRLDEGLALSSTMTALANADAPTGTVSVLEDRFQTSNRFNGAALGLNSSFRDQCWSFSAMGKLGLGNVDRKVGIHGSSSFTVPGNPPSTFGSNDGLLARSTNSGDYQSSRFVVVPEIAMTLGYRFTPGLEATVSYSYLTLPKVAQVGNQLDPQLASNISAPPTGAATPRYNFTETNYSLHSLSYGVQWRY